MPENVSTQLADDAKSYSIDLLRIEAGMRGEVVAMLDELEKTLLSDLAKADLTDAKKAHLESYLATTQAQISSAYDQIDKIGERNLERVAMVTGKQTTKDIDAKLRVKMTNQLSEKQLTAIARGPIVQGSPMKDWWNGQSAGARMKFNGAVRQGLLLGEDMAAIQRRVRGTKANGYKDGALAVSKREAEALTRTAVQSVANQAKLDTLAEQDDLVKGVEWVATLDARTTQKCMGLDGKQWRFPDYKPVGHDKEFPGAVAHWGCRSTQVAVLYSWSELAKKKVPDGKKGTKGKLTFEEAFQRRLKQQGFTDDEAKEIEADTRASMDGQVSSGKDWQQWLKDKGDDFALEKLGPGRFALWKQGKLTLSDLTNQKGRELTLAELEAAIDGDTLAPETEGREFKPAGALPKYDDTASEAEAKATAKAELLKEQQQQAATELDGYKATKEGQTLKHKWAGKVDGELGAEAPATEKLEWVKQKAAEEQAAKSKAAKLSLAKKKLLAGEAPTPAQQLVIDDLTDEEKQNFDEAVADAMANTTTAKSKAIKDKLVLTGGTFDAKMTAEAHQLKQIDQKAFDDVVTYADGLKAESSAIGELGTMLATGHPLEKEAVKAAKGATSVEKLAEVKAKVQQDATSAIFDISESSEGQKLKQQALAKALGTTTSKLETETGYLMQKKGVDPLELLKEVETVAAEKQAQASAAAKISGAKKKWLQGKEFTPAQQAAWDTLSDDQQKSYLEAWEQTKTTSKVQGGATQQQADVSATGPANTDLEIPDPDGLVKLADLSGSTKPILAQDPATGKKWVVKDSARGGGGVDHFESEAMADAIYRASGANVPGSAVVLKDGGKRAVKVAEFIEGGETLAKWKQGKTPAQIDAMHRKIQGNFVTDALLANWDVAGLSDDNLLIVGDTPIRIDNGGALFFRAQGGKKKLPRTIAEMQSLRDAGTNPNTARIFSGLTQDQIDSQVVDLLSRREKILAAATDSNVRKALSDRLDWLEEQLPAAARKPKTLAPSAPDQIPADISDRLKEGRRGAGTMLQSDGDALEDQSITTWRERAPDGTDVLKMEADLTFEGSNRILKTLEAAGMDTSTKGQSTSPYAPAKPANQHPEDEYWPPILAAAKTVSTHAADGNYTVPTINAFEDAKKKLSKAIADDDGSDPQKTAMLKHYLQGAAAVDAAKAAKQKLPMGALSNYQTPANWKPPTAAKKGDSATLDGWKVERLDRFDFTVKEMKGDVLTDTGRVNRTADYGRIFKVSSGPVEVTVLAFRDDATASIGNTRSMQGTLRVNIKSQDDPAAIEAGLQALHKLGIDARPPTDDQKELLYLHKVVALRRDNSDSTYSSIVNGSGTDAEKVAKVKDWAEKKYKVKLPREKSGWGDAYNPDGVLPSNGTGSRQWIRWDYTPAKRESLTKSKVLFHSSSRIEETFMAWVDNAGNATTTMERVRTGVDLSQTGGASSDSDISKGGGDFLYTSATNKSTAVNRQGFLFKGRNLARVDLRSDIGDSYGKWESAADRRGKLEDIAKQTAVSISSNTGLLKNGINLFDELDELRTGNVVVRNRIIKVLKARGFTQWPDGRKLEDVIK